MSIQFLHGDCLEVMKTLPDKSIDCFICDLPYGCLSAKPLVIPNTENKHRKACPPTERTGCAWDVKLNLTLFWEQVERLAKNDNTPVIHFCNSRFGFELYNSKPEWFRYDLVWNKEIGVGFLNANRQPLRSHENIYIFSKKGAYYKRIDEYVEGAKEYPMKQGENKSQNVYGKCNEVHRGNKENTRCPKSILSIKPTKSKGQHPTEKPIELYKWLLQRYVPEGGTILDPTAGSFNSCKAGKELGLHAIGIEKDLTFYEKASSSLS
jgi:site-specific DNA-methyltransferase (adenine-specific)